MTDDEFDDQDDDRYLDDEVDDFRDRSDHNKSRFVRGLTTSIRE